MIYPVPLARRPTHEHAIIALQIMKQNFLRMRQRRRYYSLGVT